MSDADSQQIPPIEIGSFIALRPDKSEFIGSASGVFFANTVFRAFATATATATPTSGGTAAAKRRQGDVDGLGATATPDPGSAHEYVMAEEKAQEQAVEDDDSLGVGAVGAEDASKSPGTRSYGVAAPGLGIPPPPAVAKRLLVEYFRRWHPFLPFLHGPTFFEKVNRFYELEGGSPEPMSQRNKVYQAIIFQCVFNIADSNHNQKQERELPEESRIKSPVALTSLLGILSSGHDIPSLQALLAVELYLMTQMSLRAASTVHGAMTRILYHCGLHRCPFRYVQLPRDICDMRKRIFWSAYVIDRHLSQVLGHPLALNDEEIDVCLPGAPEVHNPAKPFQHASQQARSPVTDDDIHAYAPVDHPTFGSMSSAGDLTDGSTIGTHEDNINTDQLVYRPQSLGESILGFLVTYSRLLGQALDLFHKSIHSRSITWDKVLEMTSKIHAWWNTLPPSFQGEGLTSIFVEPQSHHGPPFAILYHQLILIMNRPFLSLPTNRTDFQFSLQTAVNASRAIVKKLKLRQGDSPLVAWPGMLSAAWMAGLVIAYAGLLRLYPMEKTVLDLNCAIRLLGMMSRNWTSAHHCRVTLKMLLDRLTSKPFMDKINPALSADPSLGMLTDWSQPVFSTYQNLLEGSRSKRRRVEQNNAHGNNTNINTSNNGIGINNANSSPSFMGNAMSGYPASHFVGPDPGFVGGDNLWDYPSFQPVLEYTGPDFGFDADQLSQQGEWEQFLSENMNPESSGLLFNNVGWDTYVQNLGDRLNV
ncbi:fungal-specific transcription factor domain-containing protein [Trichoderma novae-zelandiae]